MPTVLRRRVLIWGCAGAALPAPAEEPERVVRVSALLDADPTIDMVERIVGEAYRRVGMRLEVVRMPGERALQSANAGDVDGVLHRRAGLERSYPQLAVVPVPLAVYEIVAFSASLQLELQDWESLRPFRLAGVRGVKAIEDGTRGMQISMVSNLQQAFGMLARGRVDLVLANRLSGLAEIHAAGLQGIAALQAPLAVFPTFHYLHVRNRALVPRVTATLRAMTADGTLARYQAQALARLR